MASPAAQSAIFVLIIDHLQMAPRIASKTARPLFSSILAQPKSFQPLYLAMARRHFTQATPINSISKPPSSTPKPTLNDPSQPSFNLFAQIKKLPRAARYTLYTGFALLVAGETTFWCNLIYAKWFAKGEQKENADLFLERVGEAVRGYRPRWMTHYRSYYGEGIWGL